MLSSKDVNFVGYTYKNFEIVNDYQVPGMGKKLWRFRKFGSDCASSHWRSLSETVPYQDDIADSCSEMMLQLGNVYDIEKIKLKVKALCGSPSGVVAAEAKKAQTHWVILDKQLKKEAKLCMEELECNLVLMKKSEAKVLRLNLIGSPKIINEISSAKCVENDQKLWKATRAPNVTPTSSPEHASVKIADARTVSASNFNLLTSPFVISDFNWDLKTERFLCTDGYQSPDESDSDTDREDFSSPSTCSSSQPWTWKVQDYGITDLKAFFTSSEFTRAKFELDEERRMIRTALQDDRQL